MLWINLNAFHIRIITPTNLNVGKPQRKFQHFSFLGQKTKTMAKGKLCPQCKKAIMYALKETHHPAGTDVIYYCKPCNFEERFFEDKPVK